MPTDAKHQSESGLTVVPTSAAPYTGAHVGTNPSELSSVTPTRARDAILALDPGPELTGWVLLAGGRVLGSGVAANNAALQMVKTSDAGHLAVEMIASYGMAVGREVFETCVWIGRFVQAWRQPDAAHLIYRRDVKLHLCGSPRAKDPNIRQALLDLLGPQGTKAAPGPTYGVKSHAWAALGVAVTAAQTGRVAE